MHNAEPSAKSDLNLRPHERYQPSLPVDFFA